VIVGCPTCQSKVRLEAGTLGACPKCTTKLRAPRATEAKPPAPQPAAPISPPRPVTQPSSFWMDVARGAGWFAGTVIRVFVVKFRAAFRVVFFR